MGKRITEKDFWICTSGALPAPFQGTRLGQKKQSGKVYITVEDKSTSSFIDFGCTKYMWLMALVVAVAVVALAVVGVITVATGGAGLILLGMVAGAVGAAIGGVIGAMLCGHKMAGGRKWIEVPKKDQVIFQGVTQVTSDYTMTCKAGGTIKFAPNIKSWGQAIAVGTSTYIKEIMKGAMTGAMVGMAGAAIAGGTAATAGGAGLRGLGQAGLQFLKASPKLIGTNLAEGFFKDFAFKGIDVTTAMLDSYGEDGQVSVGDAWNGLKESALGDYNSLKNIVTTGGSPEDWQAALMLLAPGDSKKENNGNGDGGKGDSSNAESSGSDSSGVGSSDGGNGSSSEGGSADSGPNGAERALDEAANADADGGESNDSTNSSEGSDEGGNGGNDTGNSTGAEGEGGEGGDSNESSESQTPKKDGPAEEPVPNNTQGETYEDSQALSTKTKGEVAENASIKKLKKDGYTEVLQIQNNSGHGVDVIARNPLTGDVKVVEVKANTSKLSADQRRGGDIYSQSRIDRAIEGSGHWKSPPNDPNLSQDAQTAREWIDDAPNVDYEVHRVEVDDNNGTVGEIEVTDW